MHRLSPTSPAPSQFDHVLAQIAAGASERDGEATPSFPDGPVALLEGAGMLSWNAQPGASRPPAAAELGLVRRVACADGSELTYDAALVAAQLGALPFGP